MLVDLHWDAKHVSTYSIAKYGNEEKKRRVEWKKRIHHRVVDLFPPQDYVETRGRRRKAESTLEEKLRKRKYL